LPQLLAERLNACLELTQDIITIVSSGALSSVLVFLFRNRISERIKASIQHEYDQKLNTYKVQLKIQTEAEIIRLKAQLEIAAERNVQYSRVFEKTEDVIAETYGKLLAFHCC
jgi:predicted nucleic acid-binding protein